MERGGGVLTVAQKAVYPTQLHKGAVSGLEYTAVSVTKSATIVNIAIIYRPPLLTTAAFTNKLQILMKSLPCHMLTVILENFNIDLLEYPNRRFLTIMEKLGLRQQVQAPTTDYIDHVFINQNANAQIQIVDTLF